ncbi:TIGR03084 family metal-binding protein [Pseudonocardia sp. KRD291]|uniref:TIGR03084 family metal-binding protein n=1 Tax=Pseudonocardia sp. KRD291 TaxID=2792007 RepID=UPI001C4A1A2E|nr:TIGR03084 family metal-binding protein [Pseudonocardia sp. KRD291]MBW0104052.1 TIGR03084 family protein [Pseudonocardia sp. KRD291]
MPVSMDALADDLAAESAVLRDLLAPLQEHEWRLPTPAAGWSIGDQVSHLAHFDDVAVRSATDPDAFVAYREKIEADGGIDPDTIAATFRDLTGAQLLPWFDEARARLLTSFRALDPSARVPWFGPPMSAASSLTARIMETWAHGQDVADTVGVARAPSPRLRHVAHIGIGARRYSYAVNERALPEAPIRVELAAPDGSAWTWGPDDAPDRVTGTALDFCLAVTQRRHRDDTSLTITGPAATEWMTIAQAFAGDAGTGRVAGQFSGGQA